MISELVLEARVPALDCAICATTDCRFLWNHGTAMRVPTITELAPPLERLPAVRGAQMLLSRPSHRRQSLALGVCSGFFLPSLAVAAPRLSGSARMQQGANLDRGP
jgi:hypothetical protein